MKKYNISITTFIIVFLVLFSVHFFPSVVSAQVVESRLALSQPYIPPSSLPFGQNHAYTVTFRGNGEAVVNMKAVFTNNTEATTSAFALQIPKGDIQDVSAFQVIQEPQCIRYDSIPVEDDTSTTATRREPVRYEQVCVEYSNPDYYGNFYGSVSYLEAEIVNDGKTLMMTLPEGIEPQKSGSVVLYYRAYGYVTRDIFGAFNYAFETLKSDTVIRNLSVGVNTDTDLKLEGTEETLNYTEKAVAPMMAQDSMATTAVRSAEFDQYYHGIGYGRITKTATDLQPSDSFTVTGRYAASTLQLYGKKITVGSLLAVGVILILIAVIHRIATSMTKKSGNQKSQTPDAMRSLLLAFGASLLASILSVGYTAGLFFFLNMVSTNYYYGNMQLIIALFTVLISAMVYLLFILGSAVLVGWKRGIGWGVGTVAMTVLLFCIYLGLFFAYLFVTNNAGAPDYPIMYRQAAPAMDAVMLE